MRVLVCGGRDYKDKARVYEALTEMHPSVIITGGCPTGADVYAGAWAFPVVPLEVFFADWKKHGKAAGPIRNAKMLADGKPDVVLAFPGGRGTADMVRKAKAAGVRVIEVAAPEPGDEHG